MASDPPSRHTWKVAASRLRRCGTAAVFPQVRARLPGIVFHCIGGDVPESIGALGAQEGIVIHGHVPDIAPYMDGCRVAVAPLRYGAGVKGKVNLSMAHGQPVVSTPCAVEGMHLRDGHDVLVADDAAAFADAGVRLHEAEALWTTLSRNGLDNVARHFSLDAAHDTVRRGVSAPCAVEGSLLREGQEVLVSDGAAAFADAVVGWHEEEAMWRTLGRNGVENVARQFSLDAARATVRRVFFAPRGGRSAART